MYALYIKLKNVRPLIRNRDASQGAIRKDRETLSHAFRNSEGTKVREWFWMCE